MEERPFLVPIQFSSAESARFTWDGVYFNTQGVLYFPEKIKDADAVLQRASHLDFILRLVPFDTQFRSRMLAALGNAGQSTSTAKSYGIAATADVRAGKIVSVGEVREQAVTVERGGFKPVNPGSETLVELDDSKRAALQKSLESYFKSSILSYAREVFAPFITDDAWKARPLDEFRKGLIPFSAVFPGAVPVERTHSGKTYFLEDHYSTLDSTVTCIIFEDDPESEQDVAWGGFKYDCDTRKLKVMNEFPSKYNAQEWLKQFDQHSPFSLDMLFAARANFVRTELAPHLKGNTRR